MPSFREDQVFIVVPGSKTTLAVLGISEVLTPAKLKLRSCMFRAEKEGEWEPYRVIPRKTTVKQACTNEMNDPETVTTPENELVEATIYEEDFESEEDAVWPIVRGEIVNWPCFLALMTHVHNTLNPPFHTPILLISEQCWTLSDHERLTQFFFEKFKSPAFQIMNAASAACYGYGLSTATVVDIGYEKADVVTVVDHIVQDRTRKLSLTNCGGNSITKQLYGLLAPKGFTYDMCEKLKCSSITEVLPDTLLEILEEQLKDESKSTKICDENVIKETNGENGLGKTKSPTGELSKSLGIGDTNDDVEIEEGVLDVAGIVTSGKTAELLAQREREKNLKKNKDDAAAKVSLRLRNSERIFNTFLYEMKGAGEGNNTEQTDVEVKISEGVKEHEDENVSMEIEEEEKEQDNVMEEERSEAVAVESVKRKEIEIGLERFKAVSKDFLEELADVIYAAVQSVEDIGKRGELWDSIVIVGNGGKVKGLKEALMAKLVDKYLITSAPKLDISHETSTTNANFSGNTKSTATMPVNQSSVARGKPGSIYGTNSAHLQTPTSIKFAKAPEYFPIWKEAGFDEAIFLGAQIASKVLFVVDQGANKGFMTRSDYNDLGPSGIYEYSF